jgi:hypothetical protein
MAEQAFKFPDEVEDKKQENQEEGFEIEVVDDTPPQDKGREPMPKQIVEELEKDDLEEYSEKVKTRLAQMKKVWHDERREKEASIREKEEALRFAQAKDREIKELRSKLGAGEKLFVEEVTKSANSELASAKEKLKQAYESGDAALIADAQEALTDAKLKLRDYQNFKPSLQEEEKGVESDQQVQAVPQVSDPKAAKWREKNTWFGADPEMTASALGLHEKLVRSGVDPRSEDYYQRVDATMRKRFPEYEWEEEPQTRQTMSDSTRQTETETKDSETKSPRKSANVAPVTRSTAPRQIRLTTTQVALAKKLGLTNEAYAKELMKLENRNG